MNVLGLFAKEPLPGQVKTRLAAATSPAFAARFSDACLRDLIERLENVGAGRALAYTPATAQAYFAALAAEHWELVPQADGDLGQRMARFFTDHARQATVLIGADSPTLPVSTIERAFILLRNHDLVLGPATDGGYYLIGVAGRLPPIFDGIDWGSDRVLAQTVARLDASWKLALLQPWYDIDTLADWRMLQGHLAALRKAGIDPGLPRLEALAQEMP